MSFIYSSSNLHVNRLLPDLTERVQLEVALGPSRYSSSVLSRRPSMVFFQ